MGLLRHEVGREREPGRLGGVQARADEGFLAAERAATATADVPPKERPLAIAMVGGLVTSTLFTLLALPSFYAWVGRPTALEAIEGR